MSDEPFYSPNAKPRPPRQPKPGELLFEFQRADGTPMTCELRDHGEFGTEAQFLLNGQLLMARMFRDDPALGFKGLTLAMAWLEQARRAMETRA
jgi:hypothetical protein